MRVQYFLNEVKIKSSLFINKRLVYFEHLGLVGWAFDKENGSHKGNIRKRSAKKKLASQMSYFYTTLGKIENEPLIFY